MICVRKICLFNSALPLDIIRLLAHHIIKWMLVTNSSTMLTQLEDETLRYIIQTNHIILCILYTLYYQVFKTLQELYLSNMISFEKKVKQNDYLVCIEIYIVGTLV